MRIKRTRFAEFIVAGYIGLSLYAWLEPPVYARVAICIAAAFIVRAGAAR